MFGSRFAVIGKRGYQQQSVFTTTVEQVDEKNITLDDILPHVKSSVDYKSASLMLLGKRRKKLKVVAQEGEGCDFISSMNFKMGKGLSAWLAQKKRTVCLSDIHRGARHVHNPIRSYVAIPILHKDNVIGVLNLAHVKPNAFSQKEVKVLENYAQSIVPALLDFINTY